MQCFHGCVAGNMALMHPGSTPPIWLPSSATHSQPRQPSDCTRLLQWQAHVWNRHSHQWVQMTYCFIDLRNWAARRVPRIQVESLHFAHATIRFLRILSDVTDLFLWHHSFFATTTMMMHRRFRAIAVLALSSLMVTSTSAFSANQMETRRIQRQHQLEAHRHYHHPSYSFDADVLVKTVAGIMTAGLLLFSSPLPSLADGSRVVGELRGSGLVFKVSDDGIVLCGIGWCACDVASYSDMCLRVR